MFLEELIENMLGLCFPRIRGDVPASAAEVSAVEGFSPHTRGCSPVKKALVRQQQVFPAYAGMFRRRAPGRLGRQGFPRIRGDVPVHPPAQRGSIAFSPHTRGCSFTADIELGAAVVFPAYAGMFLKSGISGTR